MNNYQGLTSYLKIVYQNLGTLHHNLVGKSFFVIHPLLGEWYEKIGEMADDLIERGIPLGYAEPSIKDAVRAYSSELLSVENRECEDTIKLTQMNFITLVEKMTMAKDGLPVDVQSKIDEYIYYLRKEADYKMGQYLGGMPNTSTVDIDDD